MSMEGLGEIWVSHCEYGGARRDLGESLSMEGLGETWVSHCEYGRARRYLLSVYTCILLLYGSMDKC